MSDRDAFLVVPQKVVVQEGLPSPISVEDNFPPDVRVPGYRMTGDVLTSLNAFEREWQFLESEWWEVKLLDPGTNAITTVWTRASFPAPVVTNVSPNVSILYTLASGSTVDISMVFDATEGRMRVDGFTVTLAGAEAGLAVYGIFIGCYLYAYEVPTKEDMRLMIPNHQGVIQPDATVSPYRKCDSGAFKTTNTAPYPRGDPLSSGSANRWASMDCIAAYHANKAGFLVRTNDQFGKWKRFESIGVGNQVFIGVRWLCIDNDSANSPQTMPFDVEFCVVQGGSWYDCMVRHRELLEADADQCLSRGKVHMAPAGIGGTGAINPAVEAMDGVIQAQIIRGIPQSGTDAQMANNLRFDMERLITRVADPAVNWALHLGVGWPTTVETWPDFGIVWAELQDFLDACGMAGVHRQIYTLIGPVHSLSNWYNAGWPATGGTNPNTLIKLNEDQTPYSSDGLVYALQMGDANARTHALGILNQVATAIGGGRIDGWYLDVINQFYATEDFRNTLAGALRGSGPAYSPTGWKAFWGLGGLKAIYPNHSLTSEYVSQFSLPDFDQQHIYPFQPFSDEVGFSDLRKIPAFNVALGHYTYQNNVLGLGTVEPDGSTNWFLEFLFQFGTLDFLYQKPIAFYISPFSDRFLVASPTPAANPDPWYSTAWPVVEQYLDWWIRLTKLRGHFPEYVKRGVRLRDPAGSRSAQIEEEGIRMYQPSPGQVDFEECDPTVVIVENAEAGHGILVILINDEPTEYTYTLKMWNGPWPLTGYSTVEEISEADYVTRTTLWSFGHGFEKEIVLPARGIRILEIL